MPKISLSSTRHVSFLAAADTDHQHHFSLTYLTYLSDNLTNTLRRFTAELNERVRSAEARASEAERQAQATQQELVRSQAGVKGKGKGAAMPLQHWSKGSAHLCRSTSLSRSKARTTSGETGLYFSQLVWTVLGGALAEIYEHVEGHCDDSATILDLEV